jgi:putative transposase
MRLVERHLITNQHPFFKEADRLCFLSKNLYNAANYVQRQSFFEAVKSNKTPQKISYETLDKQFQSQVDYQALPAKVSQHVLRQVCQDWDSYRKASLEFKKHPENFLAAPKIPKYKDKQKGRNLLIYTNQALSKPLIRQGIVKLSQTGLQLKTQQKRIQQVRVVPKVSQNSSIMEIVYEENLKTLNLFADQVAGIDVGLNNLAAVTSNRVDFKPLLVNGRPLKAINQLYHKEKALLQGKLQEKKTSRLIRELAKKRYWRIENYLHTASRGIINFLEFHEIDTLVIGKNNKWKQEIELGKQTNQNFVSIPHARFIEMLSYKAALKGIRVILTEESYTSKCSFLDREELKKKAQYVGKRVHRGLFKSTQGILINADVNGSLNIIRKVLPDAFDNSKGIEGVVAMP